METMLDHSSKKTRRDLNQSGELRSEICLTIHDIHSEQNPWTNHSEAHRVTSTVVILNQSATDTFIRATDAET